MLTIYKTFIVFSPPNVNFVTSTGIIFDCLITIIFLLINSTSSQKVDFSDNLIDLPFKSFSLQKSEKSVFQCNRKINIIFSFSCNNSLSKNSLIFLRDGARPLFVYVYKIGDLASL